MKASARGRDEQRPLADYRGPQEGYGTQRFSKAVHAGGPRRASLPEHPGAVRAMAADAEREPADPPAVFVATVAAKQDGASAIRLN